MKKTILLTYAVIINLLALALCIADKRRARRRAWRIPERVLLLTAAAGGSVGLLLGMTAFRHKTKHPKFTVLTPLLLIAQLLVIWVLARGGYFA